MSRSELRSSFPPFALVIECGVDDTRDRARRGSCVSWATGYIERLKAGETVQFRPRGNSMTPKIESGQLCTVEPIADHASLDVGDIVLCKVNGSQYIHLVSAIQGARFQISNNKGRVNGWVTANAIYGRLVKIDP